MSATGAATAAGASRLKHAIAVLDRDDVEALSSQRPSDDATLVPLTPLAEALLLEAGHTRVFRPPQLTARRQHLKDAVRALRLERRLVALLTAERRLGKAAEHALIEYAMQAAAVASRLWGLLQMADAWQVHHESGWTRTGDRSEALQLLLRRLYTPWNEAPIIQQYGTTPFRLWWNLLGHNLAIARAISRSRPIAFNAFSRGFAHLCNEIARQDPHVWQLSFNPLNADEHSIGRAKAMLELTKSGALNPKQVTLTVPPRRIPRVARAAVAVLEQIDDPIDRAGIDALRPYIIANVEWTQSILPVYRLLMWVSRCRASLVWDAADRLNAVLAEAAQRARVPSFVACHTSVSGSFDKVTVRTKARRNRTYTASPLADCAIAQSPPAEAAVREVDSDLPIRRTRPFVWGHGVPEKAVQTGDHRFTVLHAGNYFEWSAYTPWYYETSNDFVESLQGLTQATAQVADVELFIRLKSNFDRKAEFQPESLHSLLSSTSWKLSDIANFHDDLARADLVVAFHSSVVEEALAARIPVLLWGGMGRYRHLEAASTPPTSSERSAVYYESDPARLPKLIDAIRSAHHNRPLTDGELNGYVWGAEADALPDLAKYLLSDAPLLARSSERSTGSNSIPAWLNRWRKSG